jgi:hypothetical protein
MKSILKCKNTLQQLLVFTLAYVTYAIQRTSAGGETTAHLCVCLELLAGCLAAGATPTNSNLHKCQVMLCK